MAALAREEEEPPACASSSDEDEEKGGGVRGGAIDFAALAGELSAETLAALETLPEAAKAELQQSWRPFAPGASAFMTQSVWRHHDERAEFLARHKASCDL